MVNEEDGLILDLRRRGRSMRDKLVDVIKRHKLAVAALISVLAVASACYLIISYGISYPPLI
jgi:hypothetical protein